MSRRIRKFRFVWSDCTCIFDEPTGEFDMSIVCIKCDRQYLSVHSADYNKLLWVHRDKSGTIYVADYIELEYHDSPDSIFSQMGNFGDVDL